MTVGNTETVKEKVSMLESLYGEGRKDLERATTKYHSGFKFLDHISSLLSSLPEKTDDWSVYNSMAVYYDGPHVSVSYSTRNEEDSNELRGLVQKVMSIPANRKVNSFNGDVAWDFTKDFREPELEDGKVGPWLGHLSVTINHGRLAPGCELVQEEITRTEFKVVCPEGSEGSEGSEFLGASV